MHDTLEIPAFLKRNQQEPTMTNAPAPKPERKPRQKKELPDVLLIGEDAIPIEGLSLEQLIQYHRQWIADLEEMPRLELELNAINQAIRKELTRKAK